MTSREEFISAQMEVSDLSEEVYNLSFGRTLLVAMFFFFAGWGVYQVNSPSLFIAGAAAVGGAALQVLLLTPKQRALASAKTRQARALSELVSDCLH